MLIVHVTSKASSQQAISSKVFGKSKVTCTFLTAWGIGAPNYHIIQRSTIFRVREALKLDRKMIQ